MYYDKLKDQRHTAGVYYENHCLPPMCTMVVQLYSIVQSLTAIYTTGTMDTYCLICLQATYTIALPHGLNARLSHTILIGYSVTIIYPMVIAIILIV